MATTPTPTTGPNWTSLLALVEGFANLALVGLQAGGVAPPGSAQIATMLEAALNNLVTQQQTGSTTTQTVVNTYALLIAGFKAYELASGNNSALVAKIGVYLAATEAALAAYVQAGTGFDPANYAPETPIS